MRAEVARTVEDLVLAQGYESTTVEDICAASGISRSTFFRYFSTKEDALFDGTLDAADHLRDALIARPCTETPWVAMRGALDPLIERYEAGDERARLLTRLIVSTPALAARRREKNAGWHDALRPELSRRLDADPSDDRDPRVNAIIAAALGCVEASLIAWTSTDEPRSLPDILDQAMGAVR